MCENTLGSFQCVCGDGYQGDGHTCTRQSHTMYCQVMHIILHFVNEVKGTYTNYRGANTGKTVVPSY